MTTFRGIEVFSTLGPGGCKGCIVYKSDGPYDLCDKCEDALQQFQPAALHDGRPRVVLTGGRKPSFPIKAVWYRDGARDKPDFWNNWEHIRDISDILAVERADEGEEK